MDKPTWQDTTNGSILTVKGTGSTPAIFVSIYKPIRDGEGYRLSITTAYRSANHHTKKILPEDISSLIGVKGLVAYHLGEHLEEIGNAYLSASNSFNHNYHC